MFLAFKDVDELELDVIIVIVVGLKHLEHLHKKWAQDNIMRTMRNANRQIIKNEVTCSAHKDFQENGWSRCMVLNL
jgi:hypothetical protein